MKHSKKFKKTNKQLLAGLLSFVLLFTSLSPAAFTGTVFAQESAKYGDVNEDGVVDEADATQLKKYLAEYGVTINVTNADVNLDQTLDLHDLLLLEQYLAGMDVILGEVVTVTFEAQGGTYVAPLTLCKGATFASVYDEVPSTQKDGSIFAGWKLSDGTPFYAEDAVLEDTTVYAKFEELPDGETLNITSFALQEQAPNLTFTILAGSNASVETVKAGITLKVIDGSDPIELVVTKITDGEFCVAAKDGFNEGCSYQLILADELCFKDRETTIRTANFDIHKDEVDNLLYNEDIIYIQDTDEMSYLLDGQTEAIDVLKASVLSTDETNEAIRGTFTYDATDLTVGDLLCIYQTVHPLERDNVNTDYSEDAATYIEITAIEGDTISFKSINEEDADKLFFLPDTIPFSVETLPTEDNGVMDGTAYDATAWISMGYTGTPEYNKGDFLVLYSGNFADLNADSNAYYAKVTEISEDGIHYQKTTIDEINSTFDTFLETPVSSDKLLEGMDTDALEEQVEQLALESGFVEEAATYLAQAAQETEGFQNLQLESFSANVDGRSVSANSLRGIGGSWEPAEDVKVTATLGKSSKYFSDGVSLALRVEAEFSVDVGDGEMKIELCATFVEEIAVDIDVKANAKVKWIVIVPKFESLSFGANVDLKNYSGISLDVKIYSVSKEDEDLWEKLSGISDNEQLKEYIDKAEELSKKILEAKEEADTLQGYADDLQSTWETIETISSGEWTEAKYNTLLDNLGQLNVTEQLTELLHLSDEELDAGVQDLMERYSEMLETESEWITLLEQNIVDNDMVILVFAIGIKIDFVIKANINIALGANLEYVVGKRYSFWFDIVNKTSGSDTMDLLDERFAFQFYVMGAIGLKMGIKAEVKAGIISTKIGSIGLSAEFGPYIKLWGYFIYEYSKMRPQSTNTWNYDEQMMGALFLEFGLYFEIAFNAQVLNGAFAFNPTLADIEVPILTAGNRLNYYDFAYEMEDDEILLVVDEDGNSKNGYTMTLPESYRTMKYLDLVEGNLEEAAMPLSNFIVTLSNRNFAIDENTGLITVDVPDGVQYMECDLTLTWKMGKLEFSSTDITVTIPLVWTSLSTSELNQRFTASVKVGNEQDGYVQVWSERVKKNTAFDLPTDEEIKELLSYDNYEYSNINLKYESVTGYGDQETEGLTIYTDTTYYYEVTPRTYSLFVNGVQSEDGTTSQKEFTAKYGETFDISELLESGTADSENAVYTAYLKTEATIEGEFVTFDGKEINQDITRIIDNAFARDLLEQQIDYTAAYMDNSVHVTYTFAIDMDPNFEGDGFVISDMNTTIEKGSVAPDIFSDDLEASNIVVDEITPSLNNVFADITFIISGTQKEVPKHTLTYHTNCDIELDSKQSSEGSLLLAPQTLTRTGYTFCGWFTDAAFTQAFDFTDAVMPTADLDLYAKWSANTYTLTFDCNEGSLAEGTSDTLVVTYDDTYGLLPTPVRVGYKFLGWFTERSEGDAISSTDTVKLENDITLYAHWQEKEMLSADSITYAEGQGVTYNTEQQFFVFESADVSADSFQVYYKRQSLDNEYAEYAQNAGTYDIKLVREEDDVYKYFETVLVGVMTIDKAQGSISKIPSGTAFYSNILGEELVAGEDYIGDGTLSYGVSNYNSVSDNATVKWYENNLMTNIFDYSEISSDSTTVYVWVKLGEGENYLGTDILINETPITVTKPQSIYYNDDPQLQLRVTIKTSDVKNAGTDAKIYVCLDDSHSIQLEKSSYNDFERGAEDTYTTTVRSDELYRNIDGTIEGFLRCNYYTGQSWHCAWIRVDLYTDDGVLLCKGKQYDINRWFDSNDNEYQDFTLTTEDEKGYRFQIEENPLSDLSESLAVNADSENFTYEWDGTVKVMEVGEYNAYERTHAPLLSTTFGNAYYDKFITRTINGFTIDSKGLFATMAEDGIASLPLEVSLTYENGSSGTYCVMDEDSQSFTSTLTINAEGVTATQASADYSSTAKAVLSANSSAKAVASIMPRENETFIVSYSLPENAGIWGMKFAVDYDKTKVEMTDYTLGEVFDASEVTKPETYSDGRYVFLASRTVSDSGAINTTNTGTIVTLTFKAKEGVTLTDYPISVTYSQAIDADSELVITNATDIQRDFYYEKPAAEKPVIVLDSGSYTEGTWSNQPITLTPSSSTTDLEDTTFRYRIGENGEWQTVTGSVAITEDCDSVYYFKATNEDGVDSDIKAFAVKLDTTKPTDIKVSYNGSEFKSFLNSITFGLFFKERVEIKAQATDNGSGIAKYEYLATDKTLTDFSDITWLDTLVINANSKKYIYIKVTDNAGNIAISDTDGVVVYTDVTVSAENTTLTFDKASNDNVVIFVNLNGNSVNEIKLGNAVIPKTDYVVEADGTITIQASYFKNLETGNYTLTVSYLPLGENYEDIEGNVAPKDTTFALTISSENGTDSDISDSDDEDAGDTDTGDTHNTTRWFTLFVISGGSLLTTVISRKRKRQTR